MPIRSPRRIYKIEQIRRNLDDNPDGIDSAPDQTIQGQSTFIYAKIKEGIGKFLGLTPLPSDAEEFRGVFQGEGLNKGSIYRRRIGGFRVASYTLIAETVFNIEEKFYLEGSKQLVTQVNPFKTMSIGFPKGHSVWEVIYFLRTTGKISQIAALRTPTGVKHDLYEGNPT